MKKSTSGLKKKLGMPTQWVKICFDLIYKFLILVNLIIFKRSLDNEVYHCLIPRSWRIDCE